MKGFDREAFFIKKLQDSGITQGIGDDCCVLCAKGYPKAHRALISYYPKFHQKLVVGMDSFCEGVHFLNTWFSPSQLATKAFLVNYSDLIAMNAIPKYFMLSIVLPVHWSKGEISDFIGGLAYCARKYKIKIIGGDTIVAQSLQIHMTMLGFARNTLIYRDRIPPGVHLYYTSDRYKSRAIGQSLRVLKMLLNTPKNGNSYPKDCSDFQVQKFHRVFKPQGRFLHPEIRAGFVKDCAHFLKGGMDISDSILSELDRLGKLNRLKLTSSWRQHRRPHIHRIWSSGEEYEMLLAIAPRDSLRLKRIAHKHRIKLGYIGLLQRGSMKLKPPKWH